ncbi:hypothetical protein [uncultured Collinsella sp.]|uniref:hypothetical protein n=1 Tax=uncultured Collinsella sp. TaxID=165190 RepID=UPI0034590A38
MGDGNLAGSTRPRLAHREELGISVRRSHWHRGIGTRLLRAQPKAPGPFGWRKTSRGEHAWRTITLLSEKRTVKTQRRCSPA